MWREIQLSFFKYSNPTHFVAVVVAIKYEPKKMSGGGFFSLT